MEHIAKLLQQFPENDYGELANEVTDGEYWHYSLQQEFRQYQFTITQTALYYNTLVCLPTGLGKTYIAAMIIINYTRWFPDGKIFFLAPTRPLVIQQQEAMLKWGIEGKLAKNDRLYTDQLYFSTPQTFDNDLNKGLITNIVLVIFDEAHKAVGDYAYTLVVQKLPHNCRIVGLSATPGNNMDQIQTVISNLRIAKLEMRDEDNVQVKPYIKFRQVDKIVITFNNCPLITELHKKMQPLLSIIMGYQILSMDLVRVCSRAEAFSNGACFRLKEFLSTANIPFKIGSANSKKVFEALGQLTTLSYGKKILLEQGVKPYIKYMGYEEHEEVHPKVAKLKELLSQHIESNDSKVIIFTNSRENAQELCNHVNVVKNVKASIFVGQANSKNQAGMKQKEQLRVVEEFKHGLNVLVATCIAEEGLDIGEVGLIICYDSGFSPIRMIQRMGRTGRKSDGRIIVLLTEGKEEADYEKSKLKSKKLAKELSTTVLNYYSCNPRVLRYEPQLKFINGDIKQLDVLNDDKYIGQKDQQQHKQHQQSKPKQQAQICKSTKQLNKQIHYKSLDIYFKPKQVKNTEQNDINLCADNSATVDVNQDLFEMAEYFMSSNKRKDCYLNDISPCIVKQCIQ